MDQQSSCVMHRKEAREPVMITGKRSPMVAPIGRTRTTGGRTEKGANFSPMKHTVVTVPSAFGCLCLLHISPHSVSQSCATKICTPTHIQCNSIFLDTQMSLEPTPVRQS